MTRVMRSFGVVVSFVVACGGGGGTGSTGGNLVAQCKATCQKQRDAKCPEDGPNGEALSKCEWRCEQRGAVPGCEAKFDALVTCATKATIACNANGLSSAMGCDVETGAYGNCALSDGKTGGDPVTGIAAQSCGGGMDWDSACHTCLKAKCAAQFADAYGSLWNLERIAPEGACSAVWQCYCDCRKGTAACPAGGISQCPSGPTNLPPGCDAAKSAANTCANTMCPTECQGMI